MMNFKRYTEYKNSAALSIDEIPTGWQIEKLKKICRFAYGNSLPSSNREKGCYPVFGSNGIVGLHSTYNALGPCLIIGRKGSFGKVNFSYHNAFAIDTTYYVDKRHTNQDIRFLFYLLCWARLDSFSKDAAVPGLSRQDAYAKPLPVCSLDEQKKIAAFLDFKCSQINQYIKKKKKLIELLNEQKQAIINQAVTRGINPNVRLKPSGIDWLSNIPEHWETKKLKYISKNITNLTSEKSTEEAYIAMENVESWTGKLTLFPFCEFVSQVKKFQPKDVLFGKLRPYLAKVVCPTQFGVCAGEFLVLRANLQHMLPEFLEFKMRSFSFINLVNQSVSGARMPRTDWNFIGNIFLSYPNKKEQIKISAFCQDTSTKFDLLISSIKKEIELIQEYRTRLISDAITGQIDLRNVEIPAILEEEMLEDDINLEGVEEETDELVEVANEND